MCSHEIHLVVNLKSYIFYLKGSGVGGKVICMEVNKIPFILFITSTRNMLNMGWWAWIAATDNNNRQQNDKKCGCWNATFNNISVTDIIFSIIHHSQIFGPETTQQQFYECTMKNMVKDVLKGENRLLYTYGVTNSGKTYTIQGKILFFFWQYLDTSV